jgi:hypothetical protein
MKYLPNYIHKIRVMTSRQDPSEEIQEELETEAAINSLLHRKCPITAKAVEQEIEKQLTAEQKHKSRRKPKHLLKGRRIRRELQNLKIHENNLKKEAQAIKDEIVKLRMKGTFDLSEAQALKMAHHIRNLHTRIRKLKKEERIAEKAEMKLGKKAFAKVNCRSVRKIVRSENRPMSRKAIHKKSFESITPPVKETKRELKKIAKRALTKFRHERPIQIKTAVERNKEMKKRVPITRVRPRYH